MQVWQGHADTALANAEAASVAATAASNTAGGAAAAAAANQRTGAEEAALTGLLQVRTGDGVATAVLGMGERLRSQMCLVRACVLCGCQQRNGMKIPVGAVVFRRVGVLPWNVVWVV